MGTISQYNMNNAFLFVIDRSTRATAKIESADRYLSAFNYYNIGPTAVPQTGKSDSSPR